MGRKLTMEDVNSRIVSVESTFIDRLIGYIPDPKGLKPDNHYGIFVCKCGAQCTKVVWNVLTGLTRSCGCISRGPESGFLNKTEHWKTVGASSSKSYNRMKARWTNIKSRCYCKSDNVYHRYGGRGISMCARWRESFPNFIQDMGWPACESLSIDRIDNSLGYFKENCRWATPTEQSRNTRRNVHIEIAGKTALLVEWLEHFKLENSTYRRRLRRGLTPVQALTKPKNSPSRTKEQNQ